MSAENENLNTLGHSIQHLRCISCGCMIELDNAAGGNSENCHEVTGICSGCDHKHTLMLLDDEF